MQYPPPEIGPELDDLKAARWILRWMKGYIDQCDAVLQDRTTPDVLFAETWASVVRMTALTSEIGESLVGGEPSPGWSRPFVERVPLEV